MILDIVDGMPHLVHEAVCLKCLHRWIAVRPEGSLLVDLECPSCHMQVYAIATGQELEVDDDDT